MENDFFSIGLLEFVLNIEPGPPLPIVLFIKHAAYTVQSNLICFYVQFHEFILNLKKKEHLIRVPAAHGTVQQACCARTAMSFVSFVRVFNDISHDVCLQNLEKMFFPGLSNKCSPLCIEDA